MKLAMFLTALALSAALPLASAGAQSRPETQPASQPGSPSATRLRELMSQAEHAAPGDAAAALDRVREVLDDFAQFPARADRERAAAGAHIDFEEEEAARDRAAKLLAVRADVARDALPWLCALAAGTDPRIRSAATLALGAFETDARGALPELLIVLRTGDPRRQPDLVKAIARIGPVTSDAVAPLTTALGSDSAAARADAATALERLAPLSASAVLPLAAQLGDTAAVARIAAARALEALGTAASDGQAALLAAINSTDPETVRAAARALRAFSGVSPWTVKALIARLSTGDRGVRDAAAAELAAFGRSAADAIPALSEVVRSADLDGQLAAIDALDAIDPAAAQVRETMAPVLVQALNTADPYLQRRILGHLRHLLVPQAARAIPRICAIAAELNVISFADAIGTLATLRAGAVLVAGMLDTAIARSPNRELRLDAIFLLHWADPTGVHAVPILARALGDADLRLRAAAAQMLTKEFRTCAGAADAIVSSFAALPRVPGAASERGWLRRPQPTDDLGCLRAELAFALCGLETTLRGHLPRLRAFIKAEESPVLRALVVAAVGTADPTGEVVIPDLMAAMDDGCGEVRQAAVEALLAIGPAARIAGPKLLAAMANDPSADVRFELIDHWGKDAANQLRRLVADDKAVDRGLIAALGDRCFDVVEAADRALWETRAGSPPTVAAAVAALTSGGTTPEAVCAVLDLRHVAGRGMIALPALCDALARPSPNLRWAILEELDAELRVDGAWRTGTQSVMRPALVALLTALRDTPAAATRPSTDGWAVHSDGSQQWFPELARRAIHLLLGIDPEWRSQLPLLREVVRRLPADDQEALRDLELDAKTSPDRDVPSCRRLRVLIDPKLEVGRCGVWDGYSSEAVTAVVAPSGGAFLLSFNEEAQWCGSGRGRGSEARHCLQIWRAPDGTPRAFSGFSPLTAQDLVDDRPPVGTITLKSARLGTDDPIQAVATVGERLAMSFVVPDPFPRR